MLVASSPVFRSYRILSQRNTMKGRARTRAKEMACMKGFIIASEDAEKGVSEKRADFENAVFHGLPQVWNGELSGV
jgi:hypothetical protein